LILTNWIAVVLLVESLEMGEIWDCIVVAFDQGRVYLATPANSSRFILDIPRFEPPDRCCFHLLISLWALPAIRRGLDDMPIASLSNPAVLIHRLDSGMWMVLKV
jgi:hypothetical protein